MFNYLTQRKHKRIRSLLSSYLDGQVTPSEEGLVRSHLETCDQCAEELASLSLTVNVVAQLPEFELPRSFRLLEIPEIQPSRPVPTLVWTGRIATSLAGLLVVALVMGNVLGYVSQSGLETGADSTANVLKVGPEGPQGAQGPSQAQSLLESDTAMQASAQATSLPEQGAPPATQAEEPRAASSASQMEASSARQMEAMPTQSPPLAAIQQSADASDKGIDGGIEETADTESEPMQMMAVAPQSMATPGEESAAASGEGTSQPGFTMQEANTGGQEAGVTPTQPPMAMADSSIVSTEESASGEVATTNQLGQQPQVTLEAADNETARVEQAEFPASESLESDGLTLPLWQLQASVGGLFVILLGGTLWMARRNRGRV